MNLFLDDIRNPPEGREWTIARNYDEALAYAQVHGCPSYISFDHDLGEADAETGYNFAQWLVEQDLENPGFIPEDFSFYVHSANPVGAENIRSLLNSYLKFRQNS